jgi:hypothetical protein
MPLRLLQPRRRSRDEDAADATRGALLATRFARFVELLTPPVAAATLREFVAWLEDLIGSDAGDASDAVASDAPPHDDAPPAFSLELVAQMQRGDPDLARRDRRRCVRSRKCCAAWSGRKRRSSPRRAPRLRWTTPASSTS